MTSPAAASVKAVSATSGSRDHRRLCPFTGLHQFYEPVHGPQRKTRKEVGIRKTLGSLRGQLIGQFLGESILVAFLAFVIAIALAALSLPWFSSLSGKTMTLALDQPTFLGLSLV